MSSFPVTSFSIGDKVVGPPITSPAAIVTWIPDASGFDSLCRVNGPVGRFLKNNAEEMKQIAKGLAPYDTGELEGSIDVEYGKWDGGIWAEVYTDIEYALFQEYGTVNHNAQPFLRPALEAVMGPYIDGTLDPPPSNWSGDAGMIGDFNWDAESREWIGL